MPKAQKTIRFGVIGLGLMGREFASAASRWCHLLNLDFKPQIVGICDTNQSLFPWFQDNMDSIKVATSNYQDLLNENEIDAIYCALPHNLHQDVYCDILASGKHLLGEKPFGIDLQANNAILQRIEKSPQLHVACSSEFPFFPAVQRIMKYIEAGKFGRIIEVSAGLLHSSDLDPNKKINWKRIVEVNGEYGCMGDLGMHPLHVPLRAGWIPESIFASLNKIVRERPDASGAMVPCKTWDNATITGQVMQEGYSFPLTIQTYRISPGDSNTWFLKILGTEMSVEYSTKYPKTFKYMTYRSGEEQSFHHVDIGFECAYPTITGNIFEFGFTDSMLQMWAAFCDQLVHGRDNMSQPFYCATPEETHTHHRILTAALRSHEQGRAVSLSELPA
jgi:predicted dehydrogenase